MAGSCTVYFSPARTDHYYSRQSVRGKTVTHSYSSPLARETLASGDFSDTTWRAMAAPPLQRSPDTGTQRNISSTSGAHGSMGLACERLNLAANGLPQNITDTFRMQGPFPCIACMRVNGRHSWVGAQNLCKHNAEPCVGCSFFLQGLLNKGLAFSTKTVYLAAISAGHTLVTKQWGSSRWCVNS
ncbi:hypothetical protein CHARACLAT_030708 [Characodon lateralis]|uniref:Uncharacterized protein n=1 Tax=Characodon lateralis TaxID=208331 RepID=A0ABU7F0P4_9TELE|nr:hypothetical protein [Characodon lateralis]